MKSCSQRKGKPGQSFRPGFFDHRRPALDALLSTVHCTIILQHQKRSIMAECFLDDPKHPGRRIWQRGRGAAILGAALAVMILAAGIGFSVIAISIFIKERSFGIPLFIQVMSLFIICMAWPMWRDARGKSGGSIAIQDGTLTLDLPAYRSLVARPLAVSVDIPLQEIQAVETRLEDYKMLFMANIQRAYRLTLRTRPAIFLFEERALDTGFAGESMRAVAVEIAERAGVPFNDLGMVDGRAGIFGIFLTSAPSWTSAPLTQEQQRSRWIVAHQTAILIAAFSLICIVVRLLFR